MEFHAGLCAYYTFYPVFIRLQGWIGSKNTELKALGDSYCIGSEPWMNPECTKEIMVVILEGLERARDAGDLRERLEVQLQTLMDPSQASIRTSDKSFDVLTFTIWESIAEEQRAAL